ncbi:MAG: hypothetical protein CVT73_08510 [Alphaproteobacteria bacterium HGW-Alphaproteobacteria-12]|nr:MAG: hypothetical protein CVT73_08510 [Alphaproteobacteria bacterium HGW-Alphaproteobacteria-12]
MILMGNDMPVAELLGNMSLETQVTIGGLVLLFAMLTALIASNRRNQREMEQLRAEREMKARIEALMRKLEGKAMSRSGRVIPAVARSRPVRRTADRQVPAARTGKPVVRKTGR